MSKFEPHEYQLHCIERLVNEPAVGLFLRPGLGKTAITLTAAHELKYLRWAVQKVLVVAPKTVAEGTWSTEAQKWDHLKQLRISKVLGTEKQRLAALAQNADVYVTNRENVVWLVDHYRQRWPFDMVVLDESTSFKSPSSKRFKALRSVRKFVARMVLLTGTPSSNSIADLYSQIYLLDEGKRLGRTLTAFRQAYFASNAHGGHFVTYEPLPGAEQAVLDKISDLCISMSAEDYLQLPDLIETEVPVVLGDKVQKGYKQFERELVLPVDGEDIMAQSAAVLTNKLLQYAAGAVYDEDGTAHDIHDKKVEALLELLERLHEPCLVFYGFQSDKDKILAAVQNAGYKARCYKDHADAEAWNAGEVDVLLAHPASCAYGLNLQAGGRNVIWYTPNWSFELNDQGVCRLWRQGSKADKVFVWYLVAQNTVDEDVVAAVKRKTATHETVMSVLKARIDKAKKEVS